MDANEAELDIPIASVGIMCRTASEIDAIVSQSSADFRFIDVAPITSKQDLFMALSKALDLPAYLSSSWDSLDECLAEPDALPDGTHLVLVFRTAKRLRRLKEDATMLFTIISDVASGWIQSPEGWSLSLILEGKLDGDIKMMFEQTNLSLI